jgi:predicted  nucleic acid-binding Zn-ribbon protein
LQREEAGEARACIRLSGGALQAWSSLTKAEKERLAATFKEIIVYYAASRRLPIPPLHIVLQAADTIATAYTVCEQEKKKLQEKVADLEEELEEIKQKLTAEQAYRQQIEALNRQLEEEKARAQQLEKQLKQVKEKAEHTERYVEKLASILCPYLDDLKALVRGDQKATVELEALCWRRRAQT